MRRGILILLVALALTACGSARAQLAASSAPAVASNCVPGLMDEATGRFHPMSQLAGVALWALNDETADAYRVTLIDKSSSPADLYWFTVILYSGTGREVSSNSQTVMSNPIIMPGQSYTQTVTLDTNPYGAGTRADVGAMCQLYSWGH